MAKIDGNLIKRLRNEKNMTLDDLVEASQGPDSVSRSTVIRAERDSAYFARNRTVRAIAAALSVSPLKLMGKLPHDRMGG